MRSYYRTLTATTATAAPATRANLDAATVPKNSTATPLTTDVCPQREAATTRAVARYRAPSEGSSVSDKMAGTTA